MRLRDMAGLDVPASFGDGRLRNTEPLVMMVGFKDRIEEFLLGG